MRGVLLTTLGCCDDGWRPRIEGAGVESWWRKVGWRQRRAMLAEGGAAAEATATRQGVDDAAVIWVA
jgi:hypothetical protein